VRDILCQALKLCFPEAEVSIEEPVVGLPHIGGEADGTNRCRVRADVHVRSGGSVTIFDVSVINPSARSYVNLGSATVPDVGAKHRERLKRQAFAERMGPSCEMSFVPFVVEATGRMGPAALDFFNTHMASNMETWKVQQFLAKMSSTIALWNSRMIMQTRAAFRADARMEVYPGNEWHRGGRRATMVGDDYDIV